jgi:NAD+ diphosphatase
VSEGGPRQFAFQHAGLDRAEHLREDANALRGQWPKARLLVVDDEGLCCFAGEEDAPEFVPTHGIPFNANASFLGVEEGGAPWFALPAARLGRLPPLRMDLRNAAVRWPALPGAIFAQPSAAFSRSPRPPAAPAAARSRGGSSSRPTIPMRR